MTIVALGDSCVLGIGVHERDTVSARLEGLLTDRSNHAPGPSYEVINCGVAGYATREERLFYELFASQYEPDVILLVMYWNDDRSFREDARLGYIYTPDRTGEVLSFWRLLQGNRYARRRPKPNYTPTVGEILQLQEDCRRQNARLAVVFFRVESLTEDWSNLVTTVSAGLEGRGIPIIDLGPELLRTHAPEQLFVYPGLDEHPNEIGHQFAAEQLEQFLRREKLIP